MSGRSKYQFICKVQKLLETSYLGSGLTKLTGHDLLHPTIVELSSLAYEPSFIGYAALKVGTTLVVATLSLYHLFRKR